MIAFPTDAVVDSPNILVTDEARRPAVKSPEAVSIAHVGEWQLLADSPPPLHTCICGAAIISAFTLPWITVLLDKIIPPFALATFVMAPGDDLACVVELDDVCSPIGVLFIPWADLQDPFTALVLPRYAFSDLPIALRKPEVQCLAPSFLRLRYISCGDLGNGCEQSFDGCFGQRFTTPRGDVEELGYAMPLTIHL